MENAVEALKLAFAVMMFVMALTLSISSFSHANEAVTTLISMNDRENEYTYVEPTQGLTRTVGIETVVSSMYRAINQNIKIYFKDVSGNIIPLCYKTDINVDGYKIKDSTSSSGYKEIDSIDFSNETPQYTNMYIDILLGGTSVIDNCVEKYLDGEKVIFKEKYKDMYKEKIKNHIPDYSSGLYEAFKDKEFIESFGEYCVDEGTANEYTQRIITYQIK